VALILLVSIAKGWILTSETSVPLFLAIIQSRVNQLLRASAMLHLGSTVCNDNVIVIGVLCCTLHPVNVFKNGMPQCSVI